MRKQIIKRVISVRMTDEEMEDLQKLMERRQVCATDILREALSHFCEHYTETSRDQAVAG